MVLWVCGGCEFCVMVVAPWVSDLLLVVVGCWHGVWVVGMGCRVWVWPCELPACVVGESMGKKKGVAVWVAGMCGWGEVWEKKIIGVAVWVASICDWEVWEKKNYGFLNILIEK